MIPYDVEQAGPIARQRYTEMMSGGVAPMLAELLALQSPPSAETDREFLASRGMLGDQFADNESQLNYVVQTARANGYNPGANDAYLPSLAEYPGDPKAFVPPDRGRAHVKEVCEERGWACDGMVKTDARPKEDKHVPGVAPDLVEEIRTNMLRENPDLKAKDQSELREQIVHEHKYEAGGGANVNYSDPKAFAKLAAQEL